MAAPTPAPSTPVRPVPDGQRPDGQRPPGSPAELFDDDDAARSLGTTPWGLAVGDVARWAPAPLADVPLTSVAAVVAAVAAVLWVVVGSATGGAEDRLPMADPSATTVVSTDGSDAAPAPGSTSTTAPEQVVVHVAGAVVSPGLHRLAPGARVADAVLAAGGLAPDADGERVNLAAALADGSRLYVPRVGEEVPEVDLGAIAGGGTGGGGAGGGGGRGSGDGTVAPIDLNTATTEQLESLPGVGPATAKAILDHREQIGRFAAVDDLLDVRGIGEAKLEALRDLVVVG